MPMINRSERERERESLENLFPGFQIRLVNKRKTIFENSLIECEERIPMFMADFITKFYNKIECQHYLEKEKQSFRKGTVEDVIKTFKLLVERQQHEEMRAI